MKTKLTGLLLLAAILGILATGCAPQKSLTIPPPGPTSAPGIH